MFRGSPPTPRTQIVLGPRQGLFFFFVFVSQELLDSKQRGRERLNRAQRCGAAARDHTGSGGYEAIEREEGALLSSWEQWERAALQTRASLETALSQMTASEQEFCSLSGQLEQEMQDLGRHLHDWRLRLGQAEGKTDGEDAVKSWQIAKVGLVSTEPMWSQNILARRLTSLFKRMFRLHTLAVSHFVHTSHRKIKALLFPRTHWRSLSKPSPCAIA